MCKPAERFLATFNAIVNPYYGWISASQCYGEMDHGGRCAGVFDGFYRCYGAQCRIAVLTAGAECQWNRAILGIECLSVDAGGVDPYRGGTWGQVGTEAGIYDGDRSVFDRVRGLRMFGVDGDADRVSYPSGGGRCPDDPR